MKYIVMLSDGMAGKPIPELHGMTTLEAAKTPMLDCLAKGAEIGLASMVPEGMAPGSDTANLAVMGYDPKIYYTGRSPLEALSIGVDMADTDVSYRCNIVTLSEEECAYEDRTIIDHSSDEISTKDAAVLIDALKEGLEREGYEFYVGTSYRHLLIQANGDMIDLVPPHDVLTQRIGDYLPKDAVLREMMEKSFDILNNHPMNIERRAKGLHPANSAWFWGAGKKPALTSFEAQTGKRGVMISAVDLLKGIAVGTGMKVVEVEGANGGLHTNYSGKMQAAADALLKEDYDFAYVRIEAPDEMGHQGLINEKVQAIENIDKYVVGPLVKAMREAKEDFRILILPDHPTPIRVRTHTGGPIPYLLYDSTKVLGCHENYSEHTGKMSGCLISDGYQLIDYLLEN